MDILIITIITFVFSLLATFLATWFFRSYALKINLTAPDVRKKGKPMVPKWGGLVIPVVFLVLVALLPLLQSVDVRATDYILAFILSGFIGYLIGVFDDLKVKKWDFIKIGAIAFAAVPLIILHTYYPRPILPIVGRLRITILYPILVFAAFAVVPNGMNMLDLVNGIMLFSQILLVATIMFWSWYLGYYLALEIASATLGMLLALFAFNKYPAKLFVSNVGSYTTGAIITALIVFSRTEFISIILLLPMILNSFSLLASLRALLTREDILARVGHSNINVDGIIEPNLNPNAPLNIVRMIVLHGKLTEKETVSILYMIFIFSTILANLTAALMYVYGL
ncbi:MAG: hypothetical protein ACP6IP_05040 [Candidatus Njordarchaeia archaeon]